jgi:hypothetical protein
MTRSSISPRGRRHEDRLSLALRANHVSNQLRYRDVVQTARQASRDRKSRLGMRAWVSHSRRRPCCMQGMFAIARPTIPAINTYLNLPHTVMFQEPVACARGTKGHEGHEGARTSYTTQPTTMHLRRPFYALPRGCMKKGTEGLLQSTLN